MPDPMPGWKTLTGALSLVVCGVLLYFGRLTADQFMALVTGAGALTAWGLAAKIERAK